MRITFHNFGPHVTAVEEIDSITRPNGAGKTTLLNGYLWVLTGRTLGGYEPRRVGATPNEQTSVTLEGFAGIASIRRTLSAKGTTLYIGEDVSTQSDFAAVLADWGIDIELVAACADANALCADSLTSEALRKLLTRADVLDGEEADNLRKEKATIRKKRKQAEGYALSNVLVPPCPTPPPSRAELEYVEQFNEAKQITERGTQPHCRACGQTLPTEVREAQNRMYTEARARLDNDAGEADRINTLIEAWEREKRAADDAQRLIDTATRAREDLRVIDARIEEIDKEMRRLDSEAVRATLPDGVEVVTESETATGATKSVCTLLYKGVPLKSVNRAKRIEICVLILDAARQSHNLRDTVPIWIDNAETVQGLREIPNVIRLNVG